MALSQIKGSSLTGALPAISGASLTNLPHGLEIISQSDTMVTGASQLDFTLSTDDKYRYQELVLTGFFQSGSSDTYARFKVGGVIASDSGN